jgi:hypothetical protein
LKTLFITYRFPLLEYLWQLPEEEERAVKAHPTPPPSIFAKVAARYSPLVLPVPLHDLPENYMKNLPKFTGEGDLTTIEHINFFD